MVDLTRDRLRLAAQVRAATGAGTPDALQLAASLASRCSAFVTNDRRLLSRDGFVVVVVAVDADTGEMLEGPDIITRGFVYLRESGSLIEDAAACVRKALEHGGPRPTASTKIKDSLAEFLYAQTKRRPMILPVVMEL